MIQYLNFHRKNVALTLYAVFAISFIPTLPARANYVYPPSKLNQFIPAISPSKVTGEADKKRNNIVEVVKDELPKEGKTDEVKQKRFIGGPGQPEMSAFKSVNADKMVDLFSGDFSYNIPLLDVGGYPVNLFYNGGVTMDQQASWVGLGFNINPGTIMRNMRGLPDDFDGTDIVTKTQTMRPDKTWGLNAGTSVELFGLDVIGASLGVKYGISYNNQRGIALEYGINPSISLSKHNGDEKTTSLTFGANLSVNSQSGASITPSIELSTSENNAKKGSLTASVGYHSRVGLQSLHLDAEISKLRYVDQNLRGVSKIGMHSSQISFAYPSVTPSIRTILSRKNFSASSKFGEEFFGLSPAFHLGGFYSETRIAENDKESTHAAYGMLYYQNANNDKKAMLDFNRLNDGVFTKNSPTIAIPVYTYDVFSISGEGTGGSFRAYRGDLGYIRDEYTKTREDAGTVSVELGKPGNVAKGGVNLEYVFTPTTVGAWEKNNLARNSFAFKKSDGVYQSVYFKNPGEKAIPDVAYQNAIGGEELVRLKMANQSTGTPTLLPTLEKFNDTKYKTGDLVINNSDIAKNRDKRTQVISCLTAEEAERVALDKMIYSYNPDTNQVIFGKCNEYGIKGINRYTRKQSYAGTDNYRAKNHISEINVLSEDGRRYVYGLPVYNVKQVDVTFNVDNGNPNTQLSNYSGTDDTRDNQKGKDWFMEKEEMPAYTHSFLLTALLSPNYVDVKGDGVTEDDMGDAIKFNYSQFSQGYKWRTPTTSNTGIATWNEGMKSDNKDDKAHYIYGEREMWYLYSIESKNMVARFYVANDRKDDKEVLGAAGGINTTWGSQRLKKISLFSKGDLVKFGNNAKPIKTVHFEYSYNLCKGVPGSIGGVGENGKLTLESVYFTYNGNEKQRKNRYRFHYAQNPDYDYNANDRWGNYKPKTENQGGLGNNDYPYCIQDKGITDPYAAAWSLSRITLPSGGKIDIEYESDDYAYVQDRRAARMFQVTGFGKTATPTAAEQTNSALYNNNEEYDYIYVTIPTALTSTNVADQQRELAAKYFAGKSSQLFMKLAIVMPSDNRGSGSEQIPMYADIESYGVANTARTLIYIKVKRMESESTPMVQYALQFMKNYLPFKAFPGYDVSEQSPLGSVIAALGGMMHSAQALIRGEDKILKQERKCRIVETNKSFVRLSEPTLKRLGGGQRVKKVVLSDNWNKMTGMHDATYGQEYKYTKSEMVNGLVTEISSGVASWEPSIGGEENPHREILRYLNRNKGGPFDYGSVELPLAEMFFPSASVGYSRVEVLSIHRDTVKNAPGKTITEYHTTREFPTRSDYTSINDGTANVQYAPRAILQLLKIDLKKAITVSQGFLVQLNDMNGKIKSQAAYSAVDPVNPINITTNYYNVTKASDNIHKFNHSFPTLTGPDGVVAQNIIGREIEVMTDFREHKSETITTNLHFNFDFFMGGLFPIAIPTMFSPTFVESNTFRSAAILKIVNHYSILDSVVVIDKGSMVSTKNTVYDAETGNALVTRTNNEHNLPQYTFSYPAHWAYSGMGMAYKNIDATYEGLRFRNGILETPLDMSVFESGDELYVFTELRRGPLLNAQCESYSGWIFHPNSPVNRIWAVYTGKTASLTPQFVFIDKDGNPYTGEKVRLRIIRSGKRNLLDQGVGGITSLYDPIRQVGLIKRVVLDDQTGIIQTSAASFKDHWRVDNVLYAKDSAVTVNSYARIKRKDFYVTQSYTVGANYKLRLVPGPKLFNLDGYYYEFLGHTANPVSLSNRSKGFSGHTLHTDNWLLFDLLSNPVPANASIHKATLSFNAHISYPNLSPAVTTPGHFHPDGKSQHTNTWAHQNKGNVNNENYVSIIRMTSPWPVSNDYAAWNSLMTDDSRTKHDWTSGGLIPSTPLLSDRSYMMRPNRDNRIDFTVAARRMIADAQMPGNTNASGVRVFRSRPNYGVGNVVPGGVDVFQCFWASDPRSGYSELTPKMSVYYYICGDSSYQWNGHPGLVLDNDPMINNVINCNSLTQNYSFCLSKFSKHSINPYVEGIWGNWRVDTSFVYYGDRKESMVSQPVDLRKGGQINNFQPFWLFAASAIGSLSRNMSAQNVWVWNSTITQYNRKGYEIENKDPLGRFNAGLYGYNQQLPIAVGNNSRYREMFFDGFEDYDYQTALCGELCKPRRHLHIENISNKIDASQQHTGQYSLRVDAGTSVTFSAPVESQDEAGYGMRLRVDSTMYIDTIVDSRGRGFRGRYYTYDCGQGNPNIDNLSNPTTRNFESINLQCGPGLPSGCPGIMLYNCQSGRPPSNIPDNYFAVRWEGYLQPTRSGIHFFKTTADDGIRVWVNNVLVINRWDKELSQLNSEAIPLNLVKGQTYQIKVDYFEAKRNATAILFWKHPGLQNYELVPSNVIYQPEYISDANGTVNIINRWCTKYDYAQIRGNALTDTFTLVQGRKMVVGAWVKEGGSDCKCSTYTHNNIAVSFTGASETFSMQPTGSIIEGWQRYESVFIVPSTATAVQVSLSNSHSQPVYFDDVRIHPFNANMKSFVYHSSNLRLMAELDENNYSSYYEYDDDGTLIRVKKETEKGIKMITETRSALQKVEE